MAVLMVPLDETGLLLCARVGPSLVSRLAFRVSPDHRLVYRESRFNGGRLADEG